MAKLNWDRPYRGMDESGSQLDRFVTKDSLALKRKSRRKKARTEERPGTTSFFLSPASGLVHLGSFGRTLCGFSVLSSWKALSKSRATCLKCTRLSTSPKADTSSPGVRGVVKMHQEKRLSKSSKTHSYLTLAKVASLRVSRVLERAKDRRQFFITSIQGDIYVLTPTKRSKLLGELATRVTSEKLRRDYQLPIKRPG